MPSLVLNCKTLSKACSRRRPSARGATFALGIETLNVAGMIRAGLQSRALADASLAGFIAKLEYRCGWLGLAFEKVDRWFPSTRTCSKCGAVRPNMDLSERTFVCHSCGVMIDRDLNAALNLGNAESYPASGRGAGDKSWHLWMPGGRCEASRDGCQR